MKIFVKLLLLQIFCTSLSLATAQLCFSYQTIGKTRVKWNNGQRVVSKRNFFGGIRYKHEPYVFSSVENYHDYERVSVCCDGYIKLSDSKCEPICKPSCPSNTHCIRPNVCECNANYRGYTASPNAIQCEPICLPGCAANAHCIAPNKCSCNSGYKDNGSGECLPVCSKCPENSSCTKPDECTCNAGYLDNGVGECKPVCSKQCPPRSECTRPEICLCQDNYRMKDDKCWPICELECPENSQCVQPNECDCNEGYEKTGQLNATNFKCQPKCDKACGQHAECIRPNICECQPGYRKSTTEECEAVCDNACPEHATCSEPNTCTCDKGYEMLDSQKCQPICEKACPDHASCSEPNKCQCEPGYQLKLSSIYNLFCEPVCQSNCSTFGKCVQPNKCECLEGYEMDELEVCQPVCKRGCQNGLCFQPEVCICKPGYLMGPQEVCQPACSLHCQNGSCIEPEICQCHEGFKFKYNSVNICEPICEPECINGICVATNVCICLENYEPLNTVAGLNHSNCQLIQTTTTIQQGEYEETTTAANDFIETATKNTTELKATTTASISEFSTNFQLEQLRQTNPSPLVVADMCSDHCDCWQDLDEFGPLVNAQCISLCSNGLEETCLDLKLCQCNQEKNQLVCRTSQDSMEEADEPPLFYFCNEQERFIEDATTIKPLEDGFHSDMKAVQIAEKTGLPMWGLVTVGVLVVAVVMGCLLYVRFRKVQDPIMEYEL